MLVGVEYDTCHGFFWCVICRLKSRVIAGIGGVRCRVFDSSRAVSTVNIVLRINSRPDLCTLGLR